MKDYGIFKKYLRMPKPYLRGIFQMYPHSLQPVAMELSGILDKCDKFYWEGVKKMEMTQSEMNLMIKYKIARVPPMFQNRNELPTCAGATLGVVSQILDEPVGFAQLGRVLYFHSTFEENSMLAASNIVKSGIRAGVKCLMIPFTKYIAEVKTFETSLIIKGLQEVDIAVFSMIGCEYINKESGFTESNLEEIVKLRKMAGKSTILSSHLDPAAFSERYKMSLERLGAIPFKFEDSNMSLTIGQLSKELAAIRATKGGK